jgi:hypothetical protein
MADATDRPELICLWGRRRDSKSGKGATPSNTDKGIRELRAKGYRTLDVDAHAIANRIPNVLPSKLTNAITFGIGALRLLVLTRDRNRVIHTASAIWVRVVSLLKRRGLVQNRLVIRWAGNDMDYASLTREGPVRRRAQRLMEQVDACVFASMRQHQLWRTAFPALAERFVFWPTPVDVDFYLGRRGLADETQRARLVAVGSDSKRDWQLPLAIAKAGVPVTLLTEDPQVVALMEREGSENCLLLFRVGLDRSAEVLAGAGAILLATLDNDRFSGSTTVGVAAALGRPLMLDEPYDLQAYGLQDGRNCIAFHRGDFVDAIARARLLLADPGESQRLGRAIEPLTAPLSIAAYVAALEATFRPSWRASQLTWTPSG